MRTTQYKVEAISKWNSSYNYNETFNESDLNDLEIVYNLYNELIKKEDDYSLVQIIKSDTLHTRNEVQSFTLFKKYTK